MRSVQGGRCMTARNEKHHIMIPLSDFDAVSLYPSAMKRLWTVLGMPQVIPPEHLSREFLLTHTFTEDQTVADSEQFIGTYIVEIEITFTAKPRDFPLIRVRENEVTNYENKCTRLVVNQITLENIVEFQGISCNIIQGIYWVGDNANDELRKRTILTLFRYFLIREQYMRQISPLQGAFKLIMNSAYGKTTMKDIKTTNEYIPNELIPEYFDKKYNLLESLYLVNAE